MNDEIDLFDQHTLPDMESINEIMTGDLVTDEVDSLHHIHPLPDSDFDWQTAIF